MQFLILAFLNPGQRKNELPILYVSSGREFSKDFSGSVDLVGEGKQGSGSELPLFNFKCVAAATGNFSDENKLGQGGFGPVYKVNFCAKQLLKIKEWTIGMY